jgi:flagellar biosynthesis protein FliQ
MICFCYLLTGALAGLVIVCVLDDIHIYDMFLLFINRCPSWISDSLCSWWHTHLWYVVCYLLTGALAGLVIACVLDDIHIYDMFLLFINRCPSGLVIACVLDDIHIYDMFFCYLLTGALAGLVIACVLDDIHIYDMFFCYLLTGALVD